MSAIGKNPKVNWLNLEPRSTDPSNPEDGDIFYSDGTPRLEGPWVYQNGAWNQFSTGAALSTVNNITFTPQSADPGSPTAGMLFYSDGTPRTEGFWAYNGTDWVQITGQKYQEFTHKTRFTVRAASTANVTLANQVENGDSFGGVTLATNDLILVKNQTAAEENGVYVVQLSGPPVRSSSYDDAEELTYARIFVSSGTNANNVYWQTSVLSDLTDAQTWSTTPPVYNFTVPEGVSELNVLACGGGGGGGGGGRRTATYNPGGGGGGGGAGVFATRVKVTAGQTVSINLGIGGNGGAGATTNPSSGTNGSGGGTTTIDTTTNFMSFFGGAGGGGGSGSAGTSSTQAPNGNNSKYALGGEGGVGSGIFGPGGGGGAGHYFGGLGADTGAGGVGNSGSGGGGGSGSGAGGAGGASEFVLGSSGGSSGGQGGGGGGGGSSIGIGGNGGTTAGAGQNATGYGGGGGGGGGAGNPPGISSPGGTGGFGGDGYVRLSWS